MKTVIVQQGQLTVMTYYLKQLNCDFPSIIRIHIKISSLHTSVQRQYGKTKKIKKCIQNPNKNN